jgi:hypothetical protein
MESRRDVANDVRARSLADWAAYWNAQGPLNAGQRRWRYFERELRINCAAKGCEVPDAGDRSIAEIRCGKWEQRQRESMHNLSRDRARLARWKREGYSFDEEHRLVAPALSRSKAPERRENAARPRERRPATRRRTTSRAGPDEPSPESDPPIKVWRGLAAVSVRMVQHCGRRRRVKWTSA